MQMKQPAKQLLILQSSSLKYHDYQTSQVSWRLNGLKTFSIRHEQVSFTEKDKVNYRVPTTSSFTRYQKYF